MFVIWEVVDIAVVVVVVVDVIVLKALWLLSVLVVWKEELEPHYRMRFLESLVR